ncbi:three-helix bundle dimerization domain-containing protein [Lentzea sp. NPDC059081]|uniref:three-helix bundle dimerization domain-containing protein n=1 Tax=Lentzea sp. NPDC059081 TaxID=3346719 RepID=UPI0036B77F31
MTGTIDGHQVRDPHGLHADAEDQLRQAESEVQRRVGDQYDDQAVRGAVREAYDEIAEQAKVESFLPILVARSAEQKLEEA